MRAQTALFRQLHASAVPLCLPNAWDAGSARLFEIAGAKAVVTTSAGVAWALGYPDGRAMPADAAIALARNMTRVLTVPLSFDVEHGYADSPDIVAAQVMRLAEAGVAGINIEDGPDAPEVLAKKIDAIKQRLAQDGVDLFVNARTDIYLAALVPDGARVAETLARARLYADAGADGLFVPGLYTPADIQTVAAGISLPLNVMAWPGLPAASELAELGVRRLSAGSGIAQVLMGVARGLAQDFLSTGNSAPIMEQCMPYGELQGMFTSHG